MLGLVKLRAFSQKRFGQSEVLYPYRGPHMMRCSITLLFGRFAIVVPQCLVVEVDASHGKCAGPSYCQLISYQSATR